MIAVPNFPPFFFYTLLKPCTATHMHAAPQPSPLISNPSHPQYETGDPHPIGLPSAHSFYQLLLLL